MQETVLLLEDDAAITRVNKGLLEMNGYRVLACASLKEARRTVWEETPDLMVLDVRLPDGSGRDFCREYREEYGSGTPVLFLTVMKESRDIVAGYKAGATDYLLKPFDVDMLLLKVRALLENRAAGDSIVIGALRLDCFARIAYLNEVDLLLTPKEYSVLEYLARSRSRFVKARELYEKVWGSQAWGERTVREHIREIRKKLGGGAPVTLLSRQGNGYRLIREEEKGG